MTTSSLSLGWQRCAEDRLLAGVAGGIARALGVEAGAVRLAFVLLAFVGGAGVPLYVVGWMLMPEEGAETSLAAELLDELSYQRSTVR